MVQTKALHFNYRNVRSAFENNKLISHLMRHMTWDKDIIDDRLVTFEVRGDHVYDPLTRKYSFTGHVATQLRIYGFSNFIDEKDVGDANHYDPYIDYDYDGECYCKITYDIHDEFDRSEYHLARLESDLTPEEM